MAASSDRADLVQRPDDPRVEVVGMLLETHNEVHEELRRRFEARHDMPLAWLGVLIALGRSPDQRMRMTQLARDMTMSTSGLTRLIDRIEAAGYVRREACPEDRRGLWAVLTSEGREVLSEVARPHLDDIDELVMPALSATELHQLTDLLRRVRDHVRARTGRG